MQALLGVLLEGPSRLQAHLYTGDEVARLMRGAGRRTRGAARAVKRLLQPARAMLPEPALAALMVAARHRAQLGRYPNLILPRSFNERLLHRTVFDHRPIWTLLQDKYAAREYVRARVGVDILPTLYWVTQDPSDIPFHMLPARFVVKPTHGCKWYRVVRDAPSLDRRELIEACRGWLSQNYYFAFRDWAYKHIAPRILVEEYIDDGTGSDPTRYKFYVFHGRAHAVYVGIGPAGRAACGFYDRAWTRLPVTIDGKRPIPGGLRPPKHWAEMLRYADALGEGLDFIRVDLYDTPDKVYFGEMTTMPGSGTASYAPREFDDYLGELWGDAPSQRRGTPARSVSE
jgi:TupA-like ATPgrasp